MKRSSVRLLSRSHPWHQIKRSSLGQRLIVNLIITDNYNYLMVGAQIIVINLSSHQFRKQFLKRNTLWNLKIHYSCFEHLGCFKRFLTLDRLDHLDLERNRWREIYGWIYWHPWYPCQVPCERVSEQAWGCLILDKRREPKEPSPQRSRLHNKLIRWTPGPMGKREGVGVTTTVHTEYSNLSS